MTNNKIHIFFNAIAICLIVSSCVDPFDAQTEDFQDVLVIDAKLTTEAKKQQVLLSRTQPFENFNFEAEGNAQVQIIDDTGNRFEFEEYESGRYESVMTFAAQEDIAYQLIVTTANGQVYESESVTPPKNTPIKEVKGEIDFNDQNVEGLLISLSNTNSNSDAKYFRYEYEETYKIVAPYPNPLEFDVVDSIYFGPDDFDTIEINLKPRIEEAETCYQTLRSTEIDLSDTQRNTNNETGKIPIRFLNSDDFKISHRYSILVRQLGLTQEAHSYYTNLDNFSSSESVFNEIQPGFLEGNIKAIQGAATVVGYFEVASSNEQRYFFNYTDFFPNRPLPAYAINCDPIGTPAFLSFAPHVGPGFIADGGTAISPLLQGIQSGLIAYFATNSDYEALESVQLNTADLSGFPYFVKAKKCVDCRELGSNVKPDFWIE